MLLHILFSLLILISTTYLLLSSFAVTSLRINNNFLQSISSGAKQISYLERWFIMENICVVLRRMGTASVVLLPSCRASLEFLVIITLLEVVSCPYPPLSGHALQPWHASEAQPEAAQRTDFHKSQNRVNPENAGCGSSSLQGHYST